VLRLVKQGRFLPDESRSGRFTEDLEQLPQEERLAAPSHEIDRASADSHSASSSSSGSTSSESDNEQAVVDAAALVFAPRNSVDAQFDAADRKTMYKHKAFGTVHFQKHDVAGRFLCGRVLHAGYERILARTGALNLCDQCASSAQRLPEATALSTA
jgi:hypothetical protein